MKQFSSTRYDFNIDLEKIFAEGGQLDDLFYLQDLRQRKIYLFDEISQTSVPSIVRHILQFNRDDEGIPVEDRAPILLYVTSNGGSIDDGFELIDAILTSITPVYTINLGYQYSMGFLIGLAGHRRFAMPNAKFLMHDGASCVFDSGAKAQDRMEFNRRVEQRIKDYVVRRTNITPDEYDSKLRVEWYMFSDEAKQRGVIDFIIGDDCLMSEVV